MEKCADHNCDLCNSKIAQKRPYLSQYQSPNIIIIPTVSFREGPSAKKFKCESATRVTNDNSVLSITKQIKHDTEAVKDGNNKNTNVVNNTNLKSDRRSSWASSYLQSIGQEQNKQTTKFINKKSPLTLKKVISPTIQKVLPFTLQNENQHDENILLTQLTNIHSQSNCNINQTSVMQNKIDVDVKKSKEGKIPQSEISLVLNKTDNTKTDKHHTNNMKKLHTHTKHKLSERNDTKYKKNDTKYKDKNNDTKYKDENNKSRQRENKKALTSKASQINRHENSKPRCEKGIKLQTKENTKKLLHESKSKSNHSQSSTSTRSRNRDKCASQKESRSSSCHKCNKRSDFKTSKKKQNILNDIDKNASCRDSRKHVSMESNSTQPKLNELFKEKHKNKKDKTSNKNLTIIERNTVESNRATPIKSVVQIKGNFDMSNFNKKEVVYDTDDLRRKLNKKSQNLGTQKERDNLIITVPNSKKDNLDAISQPITITNQPEQEIHTIKLVINVICKKTDEPVKLYDDEKKHEKHQLDLSFLDDFNVDDIVECLNYCEDKLKSATTSNEKPLNKINTDGPNINTETELSIIENSNIIEVKKECDKQSVNYERSIYEGIVKSETSKQQLPLCDDLKSNTKLNKVDATIHDKKEERNITTEIININDENKKEEVANDEQKYKSLEVLEILDTKDLAVSQCNNSTSVTKNISSYKLQVDELIDLSENSSQSISITERKVIDTPTITFKSQSLNKDSDGLKDEKTIIKDTEIIEIIDLDSDTPEVEENIELEWKDPITSAIVDKEDLLVLHNPTIDDDNKTSSYIVQKEQIIDLSENSDEKETELDTILTLLTQENTSLTEENVKDPNISTDKTLSELLKTDLDQTEKNNDCNQNTDSDILNVVNDDNKTYKETEKVNQEKNKALTTTSLPKSIKSNTKVTACNCKSSVQISSITEPLEKRMSEYFGVPYTVISLIHGGKYSKIFKCRNSLGVAFSVKILNKASEYGADIHKEDMLKQLQRDIPSDNLYCIFLIDGFSVKGNWCFLTEYYPYDLKRVLDKWKTSFHIDTVQELARQLVAAVIVLRNNNVVHSDIKPGHILLNNSLKRLKLCGFDEAQYADCIKLLPNIGMASYRPPELILGYSSDFSIDVWASALVLYEMATARKLFPGVYNNDILYKQMCTFGNIPWDMVHDSIYRDTHFCGESFIRRSGYLGKNKTMIRTFMKSARLPTSIFEAYNRDWGRYKNKQQNISDSIKLRSFHRLLEQMLVLHPKFRLPIEYVYANSFIFDSADYHY